MEHSKRTTYLQKIEKAVKSDNAYLLKKTLKIEPDKLGNLPKKSDFYKKELEGMRLPTNILHFICENNALDF